MAIEVRKKDKENAQNLAHRFTKTVRQSGLLLQVRSKQFAKKQKSDLAKKKSALRKIKLVAERKQLEKLSKPTQNQNQNRR
jgi:hypothetical protein